MKQTRVLSVLGMLALVVLATACGDLDNPVGIDSGSSSEKYWQNQLPPPCPPGTPLWPTDGRCRPQVPARPQPPPA